MPVSASALRPLLRVATVPGVGSTRLATLLARFGSADRVLGAPAAEIAALPGFGAGLARRVAAAAGRDGVDAAERALETMRRAGAVALTPDDLAYPEAFGQLADPPYLLFAAGRLELLGAPGVAIVGTRAPTAYGRATAAALSRGLVAAGYQIVSGMARGIDTVAHAAALDAGGASVGVLGNGIDQVYPAANRGLFARMRTQGLLLTEFLPGETPQPGNFPRRNRLVAALSAGVLVVEMGLRSGAQHTVTSALELGRDVFAVPGPIDSAVSEGTNALIRDGARVVTSAADVVDELRGVSAGATRATPRRRSEPQHALPLGATASAAEAPADASADEVRVFRVLSGEPRHVDDLAAAAEMRSDAILAALLGLELRGVVEALPGKRFRQVAPR